MSDAVGLRSFGRADEVDSGERARPALSSRVDVEIDKLVEEARTRARAIVSDHRQQLDRLAERLMVAETLEKAAIDQLLADVARDGVRSPGARRSGTATGPPLRRRPPKAPAVVTPERPARTRSRP